MADQNAPRTLNNLEKEVHLSDYLNVLLRRWRIAAIIFALVFTATVLNTLLTTPIYEAYATLQVRTADQRGKMMKELGVEGENNLSSVIEVLKSRSLAEQVARRLYPDSPSVGEQIGAIKGSIKVESLGKDWDNNMLRVSSQSSDPVRAKDVVNLLIEVYLASNVASKAREAGMTVDFISQQLAVLKANLDKSEQELQEYKVKTGLTTLGPEGGSLVGKVVGLEQQKVDLSLKRQRVEYAIGALNNALSKGGSFTPPVIEGAGQVGQLAARLAELEAAKKGLLVNFTPAHPSIIEKDAEIRRVQEAMLSAYQSVRQELTLAERDAVSTISSYDQQLKEIPETELELAKRTRVHKVNAELYNFLLQKQQEASIAQASTLSGAEVIDPAITPKSPIKPNRTKNLALGLVLGLMLGVGLVFLIDYMDQTIKTTDDVRDKLGLAVFGIIPRIPFADEDAKLPRKRLITTLAPKAPVVEAFRALRTNLHYITGKASHKVIMITSCLPNEGKSTVSGNLAVVLAQTGAKILLIGCDLRRPSLYEMFGESHEPGLTDLLIEQNQAAMRHLQKPKLDFLPAGRIPPNPADILGSERMKKLLLNVRERYDYVVIDAPPILPVTDAQVLGPLVDITLVVLEPCRVPERAALQMIDTLQAVDVRISGVVLNDKSGRGFKYYGNYGYYGNRYYRGYYGEHQDDFKENPAIAVLKRVWKKLNS